MFAHDCVRVRKRTKNNSSHSSIAHPKPLSNHHRLQNVCAATDHFCMEGMDGLQAPEGLWSSQTSSGYNFETTSICSAEATSNLFTKVKKPLTEYVARWLVKDPQNL